MPRSSESEYVVQRRDQPAGVTATNLWMDLATVTVPQRTRRATIIDKALADSGERPPAGETWQVRVLDAASAHETPVTLEDREPTLKIG